MAAVDSAADGGSASPASDERVCKDAREDVRVHYKFGRVVGEGAFSKVYSATHRESGRKVAIKRIKKRMVKRELLTREVDIMTRADHPNVLRCYEVFETRDALFLVLPLVHGGELYDAVVDIGEYTEREAKVIIVQLLAAVEFIHSKGIAHRDLKPENILLRDSFTNDEGVDPREERFERILLADFGLSKIFTEGDDLKSACGSPTYVAPEVLLCKPYTEKVDLWAVGVIAFVLLTGCFPFFEADSNFTRLYQKIITVEFTFPSEPELSDDARHFIQALLVRDPDKRLNPRHCFQHPWLADIHEFLPDEIAADLRTHNERMAAVHAGDGGGGEGAGAAAAAASGAAPAGDAA